jgi:hypothetical protein
MMAMQNLARVVGSPVAVEELKRKPGRRRRTLRAGNRRTAIVKIYESERAPVVAAPDHVPMAHLVDEALEAKVLHESGVPVA